jgi:hypothetical protein
VVTGGALPATTRFPGLTWPAAAVKMKTTDLITSASRTSSNARVLSTPFGSRVRNEAFAGMDIVLCRRLDTALSGEEAKRSFLHWVLPSILVSKQRTITIGKDAQALTQATQFDGCYFAISKRICPNSIS